MDASRIVSFGSPIAWSPADHPTLLADGTAAKGGGAVVAGEDTPTSDQSEASLVLYNVKGLAAVNEVSAETMADWQFANANLGSAGYQYGPTDPAYSFSGSAGITAATGTAFTAQNPTAPDSTNVGFLQNGGSISQTVSDLTPGSWYAVRFQAAQRTGYSPQTVQVAVDGTALGQFTPSSSDYQDFISAAFFSTAGPHAISFTSINANGQDATAFVTDLQVVQVAPQNGNANALSDPQDLSGTWSQDGNTPSFNSALGTTVWSATGPNQSAASAPVAVTAGEQLKLTGFINAQLASSGSPSWSAVTDTGQTIAVASEVAGKADYVESSFIVPDGVTSIRLVQNTNDTSGTVVFSDPALEQVTNLVPDPANSLNTWTMNGMNGLTDGASPWNLYNTFNANASASSSAFATAPGQVLRVTGYIDARNMTAGTASWGIYSNDMQLLGEAQMAAGQQGWVTTTVTVPLGFEAACISANVADGAGTGVTFAMPTIEQVGTTNLVPSPDLSASAWTSGGLQNVFTATTGLIWGGTNAWLGTAARQYALSSDIAVTQGESLSLTGYIDASGASSGTPSWRAVANTGQQLALASIGAGAAGVVQATFVIPAGVTAIHIGAFTKDSVGQVVFAQPLVQKIAPELVKDGSAYTIDSAAAEAAAAAALSAGIDSEVANQSGFIAVYDPSGKYIGTFGVDPTTGFNAAWDANGNEASLDPSVTNPDDNAHQEQVSNGIDWSYNSNFEQRAEFALDSELSSEFNAYIGGAPLSDNVTAALRGTLDPLDGAPRDQNGVPIATDENGNVWDPFTRAYDLAPGSIVGADGSVTPANGLNLPVIGSVQSRPYQAPNGFTYRPLPANDPNAIVNELRMPQAPNNPVFSQDAWNRFMRTSIALYIQGHTPTGVAALRAYYPCTQFVEDTYKNATGFDLKAAILDDMAKYAPTEFHAKGEVVDGYRYSGAFSVVNNVEQGDAFDSDNLANYLSNMGELSTAPPVGSGGYQLGDILFLKENGQPGMDHTAIVLSVDGNGNPTSIAESTTHLVVNKTWSEFQSAYTRQGMQLVNIGRINFPPPKH